MTPEIKRVPLNSEDIRVAIPREILEIFEKEQAVLIKRPIGAPGFWPIDPGLLTRLQQKFMANKELAAKFEVVLMPK